MDFCPDALWESLARADDTATFFQTPAWHGIAARHFGAQRHTECAPLLFDFPEGPACLPLLRDRRWGRWRYFSPFGTYAAVVCPRALNAAERGAIEAALKRLSVHLVSSPFTRNPVRAGRTLPSRVQVLDLEKLDANDVARGWERDARRRLRHARAEGLSVRPAEGDKDWDDYEALYRGSIARWGRKATAAYPPALLRDIRATLEGTPGFRLWLGERDSVAGAGFMGFYHNRHACLWHAAADAEFFRRGAVQLLYHDMIADAARRGFAVFDLLGSGGLAGVEAFKASLGAETRAFDSWLNRAGLAGAIADRWDRLRMRG